VSDPEREPPQKVRITKLQEAQIPALLRVERACTAMYHEIGFDAAEVPARTEQDFYRLPRDHAVRVVEADDEVAGYAAWRDEAPGVVYLEELSVHPSYQRLGLGTKLVGRMMQEAREGGFHEVVLRIWDRASWAKSFYDKAGFGPVTEASPSKVRDWLARKESGQPFLRPGERVLWAAVPRPPAEDETE
jgi:amino-acid N-acetyltransferase